MLENVSKIRTIKHSYCYWNQAVAPEDQMNWKRTDGSTGSTSTGPQFDHTLGTPSGHYAYIEASDGDAGDRARLISSVLQPSMHRSPAKPLLNI